MQQRPLETGENPVIDIALEWLTDGQAVAIQNRRQQGGILWVIHPDIGMLVQHLSHRAEQGFVLCCCCALAGEQATSTASINTISSNLFFEHHPREIIPAQRMLSMRPQLAAATNIEQVLSLRGCISCSLWRSFFQIGVRVIAQPSGVVDQSIPMRPSGKNPALPVRRWLPHSRWT